MSELDERRLYLRKGCSSMFAYCADVLHLSEAEAYLRITAARASRQHPVLLAMLADGRLHLSTIARLAPHLTSENRDSVLARAVHKSKREVLELVAELAPKPDASELIRKLPVAPAAVTRPTVYRPAAEMPASVAAGLVAAVPPPATAGLVAAVLPPQAAAERASGRRTDVRPGENAAVGDRLCPDAAEEAHVGVPSSPRPADVLEPISPGRYRVQFTASAALREKLERLQSLMSCRQPVALALVIEAAIDEKLRTLSAKRLAAVEKPRQTVATSHSKATALPKATVLPKPTSRHVPAAVRREVWKRDGARCAFVGDSGHRCTERRALEIHHRHPFAMGGDHSLGNVAVFCRSHNMHLAEIDYGRIDYGRNARGGSATPADRRAGGRVP
jgi:5-methylcytosine-specific restriction endonuclease McrA